MNEVHGIPFFFIIISCSVLFLESCSIMNPATLEPRQIGNSIGLCHAGQTKTEREYQLLDDIGCEWLRVDYHWNSIEKTPGDFDFSSMDQFTKTALQHNKKIIAVLCYDAGWIHNDNKTHEYISPKHDDSYIRFVTETVKRYKNQVAAFEIWNEPNLKTKRFWKGSDDEFINLFSKTVKAIKSIDSSIVVTTPGLFRGDDKYLQKMFEAGAMEKVDVISFHPYSVTLSGFMKQIGRIQDKAKKYGFKGDFWISEIGYPTGGLYPTRVSESKFPEKIVKTLVYGLSKDIKVITWYHLFDPGERDKSNSEDFFGLVIGEDEYKLKNGIYAYRAIARNISNSRFSNSDVKCDNRKIKYCNFEQDDRNCLLVLWANNGRHKINISVPSAEIQQWSISSPEIRTLSVSTIDFNIGKLPVVLTYNNKEKHNGNIIISKIKHVIKTEKSIVSIRTNCVTGN
jgi:polysaccharide biosynthesis protein PslG